MRPRLAYKVLYRFTKGVDGFSPESPLYSYSGMFYGTTFNAGDGFGTVFSVSNGGAEKVLHTFGGGPGDGAFPQAPLLYENGAFYGTTANGGASCLYRFIGCGTVFSITTSGIERVIHSFGTGSDGAFPMADLIDVAGTLYGTTQEGGAYGYGTVFSISTSGSEKVVHSFGSKSGDGVYPMAGLHYLNGVMYGTTRYGGANGAGTVFSVSTASTGDAEKVLHSFGSGSDGSEPYDSLIEVNGTLYGTTARGGYSAGGGTVFSITPSGVEKVQYSFCSERSCADGTAPYANLIKVKDKLYGTTFEGGAYRGGTLFRITMAGKETVLHNFGKHADGSNPQAGLIYVNGRLYGTTNAGGYRHCVGYGRTCGTVFALAL